MVVAVSHLRLAGGQYTNLLFQSQQLGLSGRWPHIKRAYASANRLLGDIIKVNWALCPRTGIVEVVYLLAI